WRRRPAGGVLPHPKEPPVLRQRPAERNRSAGLVREPEPGRRTTVPANPAQRLPEERKLWKRWRLSPLRAPEWDWPADGGGLPASPSRPGVGAAGRTGAIHSGSAARA